MLHDVDMMMRSHSILAHARIEMTDALSASIGRGSVLSNWDQMEIDHDWLLIVQDCGTFAAYKRAM